MRGVVVGNYKTGRDEGSSELELFLRLHHTHILETLIREQNGMQCQRDQEGPDRVPGGNGRAGGRSTSRQRRVSTG